MAFRSSANGIAKKGKTKGRFVAMTKGGKGKFAAGGETASDMRQDKQMIKSAVHKHERGMHKGEPLTKLKKGGKLGKC